MTWKLLDYDPVTKLKTWHQWDASSKRNVLKYEQPTDKIIDENKAIANHGHNGWVDRDVRMQLVARVPVVLLQQWATETGTELGTPEFQEVMRMRLNDPDYKHLRTCTGTV